MSEEAEQPESEPEKYEPDALDITPMQLLQDAIKDLQDPSYFIDERTNLPKGMPDKALLILLWDEDRDYTTRYRNSGMKLSEIVALLEVMKTRALDAILADPEGEDDEAEDD